MTNSMPIARVVIFFLLDQNVFVYRLTFRWPKSDCDVDKCTSKYYLLLALVC